MIRSITEKIVIAVGTLWLAITVVFLVLRILPGDAMTAQLAGTGLPEAVVQARRDAYHLDEPIAVQYVLYMRDVLRGDLGDSLYGGQTVNEILRQRIPPTVTLALLSMLIALSLGLLLGLISGFGTWQSVLLTNAITDLSFSIPVYWTATIVLFVIASWSRNTVLVPAAVLGFHTAGAIARITHVNIREVKNTNYIRTAQGKGLPPHAIRSRHMLRVAILPVIPVIAVQSGILFSGTVITESIFQRVGLGLTLLNAVLERNYPVVQGCIIVTASVYIVINLIADIVIQLADPRLRYTA